MTIVIKYLLSVNFYLCYRYVIQRRKQKIHFLSLDCSKSRTAQATLKLTTGQQLASSVRKHGLMETQCDLRNLKTFPFLGPGYC